MIITCYTNDKIPNDCKDKMMEGPSVNDDFPMGVLHVNDHMHMDLDFTITIIPPSSPLDMNQIDPLIEQFRRDTNQ
jgi:hypothetical protein